MKVDIVIDGIAYSSKPYIGNEECLSCDIHNVCGNFEHTPCSIFSGKVVFEKNKYHEEPTEKPCAKDIIEITKVMTVGKTTVKVGDRYEVISSWDCSWNKEVFYVAIRTTYRKVINSGNFSWRIIGNVTNSKELLNEK